MHTRARTVIVVALGLMALTACSGATQAQPVPTVTVSVTVPAPTPTQFTVAIPEFTSKIASEKDQKSALSYLNSPDRIKRYSAIWPSSVKVAKALLDGKFGQIEKYDEDKKPLKSDYIGWGGMQAKDKSSYAWVYWHRNGVPDFSKGVQGFTIHGLQIEKEANPGSYGYPYTVFVPRDGYTLISAINYIGVSSPLKPLRYPMSIKELADLDNLALDTLHANLVEAGLS